MPFHPWHNFCCFFVFLHFFFSTKNCIAWLKLMAQIAFKWSSRSFSLVCACVLATCVFRQPLFWEGFSPCFSLCLVCASLFWQAWHVFSASSFSYQSLHSIYQRAEYGNDCSTTFGTQKSLWGTKRSAAMAARQQKSTMKLLSLQWWASANTEKLQYEAN